MVVVNIHVVGDCLHNKSIQLYNITTQYGKRAVPLDGILTLGHFSNRSVCILITNAELANSLYSKDLALFSAEGSIYNSSHCFPPSF